jgi:hypothetical protein
MPLPVLLSDLQRVFSERYRAEYLALGTEAAAYLFEVAKKITGVIQLVWATEVSQNGHYPDGCCNERSALSLFP